MSSHDPKASSAKTSREICCCRHGVARSRPGEALVWERGMRVKARLSLRPRVTGGNGCMKRMEGDEVAAE